MSRLYDVVIFAESVVVAGDDGGVSEQILCRGSLWAVKAAAMIKDMHSSMDRDVHHGQSAAGGDMILW